ncbi:MAG: undecaprenyl/decaprenyl-phosphate alpha-N-acetylglucosaminyl 1-phosphate transferase [Treponema sp.]|nr:undecaprenyl/decaprenyl-phosphate alpha-N-acetylglucosaminyl 1-phosphate transferase [Treponema sp.]
MVLRISHKKSWYDHINERKIHTGNIPRLGGVGFAAAFVIAAVFVNFAVEKTGFGLRFLPVLPAMFLIIISGAYDDFRPMAPRYKLLIQIIAALCVIIPGFTFHQLLDPAWNFSGLNWIRYPLTFIWIVGLINAINFIDGIDGLAGGISLLAALTFALIAFSGSGFTALFCICLAGAVGGFLVFNAPFPGAKIFMGDGGSQFLGFTLALFPLIEERNSPAALPVLYAAALLGIPIFDLIASIWRRVRDGRRIYNPDKYHLHHKLMRLTRSARRVDLILWGLQIVLGALVYFAVQAKGRLSLIILGAAYAVIIAFFTVIHFLNRRITRRSGGPGKLVDELPATAD